MSTPAELLQRHRPFLKYDSHENYFADSAAVWTDNPGNRLLASDGMPALTPTFSPDGAWVAYVRDAELYVLPADGGDARQLTHDARGTGNLPAFLRRQPQFLLVLEVDLHGIGRHGAVQVDRNVRNLAGRLEPVGHQIRQWNAARAGIACDVYVPEGTSDGKVAQLRAYGATVHRIPGTREDTADVFQEVFHAVARHLGDFRRDQPGASFRGWLRVITRNKIRDHFRDRAGAPAPVGGSDAQRFLSELPDPLPDDPPLEPAKWAGHDAKRCQFRAEHKTTGTVCLGECYLLGFKGVGYWFYAWAAEQNAAAVADELDEMRGRFRTLVIPHT